MFRAGVGVVVFSGQSLLVPAVVGVLVVVCGLGCQVDSGREHLFFLVAATVPAGALCSCAGGVVVDHWFA